MTDRVKLGPRVTSFLHTLAPGPRRALWQALKALTKGEGDVKQLEGNLTPYWRLRASRIRVIYAIKAIAGERRFFCFYAGYRATVYEVVEQLLASGLIEELEDWEA